MHLAFRVQSEEFLVVTRIKLRDVLHPFLFRIPNFGGARFPLPFFCKRQDKARNQPPIVGMKNRGNKKEKVFFPRNIVCYKGEDTLVLYSQKDFHCPRWRRRWDFLIAQRSLAYSKAFHARIFRYLIAQSAFDAFVKIRSNVIAKVLAWMAK